MAGAKSFSLAPHSEKNIELKWEGTALHVLFGGEPVATLQGGAERKRGWSTTLPNGKLLEVRTLRPVLLPELSILVDGKHVDDSPSHPHKMLRASAQGLLIGAGIFVLMMVSGNRPLSRFGIAYEVLQIAGAILLLRRMYAGLVLVGIAILADFILLDLALFTAPGRYLIWPIVSRLLFTAFLIRSFIALHELRRRY